MEAPHVTTSIAQTMNTIGSAARQAYLTLSEASTTAKNTALYAAATALRTNTASILAANNKDLQAAEQAGIKGAMLERLTLDEKRVEAMASGLEAIAELPDPVGITLAQWDRPNGLHISRISVALGVIGIIYESRPNVTADAAALCLKAGNAAILRGGSDSLHSSQAIAACLHQGLREANLPTAAIQLVPTTDRAAVGEMLTMIGLIDVIIPRGGKSLTQRVLSESRIPTLLHLTGNCHSYIHSSANPNMALDILVNAKMRRTGICGATESVVIDCSALSILPKLVDALTTEGCKIRGDAAAQAADSRIQPANEEDWGTEYLDAIISVKVVDGIDEAIRHINHYSSHHTDAIIAEDANAAEAFTRKVDSAIVMHNASTQFADGGEFGMGAEIGIATGRLHARGPVGAAQLTTYKYVVQGTGQVRPK
ncbi:MAG: glutamate-5-semialdehyde dehydrogenase [Alphaproteobacteria bacterium]|nr:glutamate-5-semialdehyde dehydrogenase [Alphaproteobacteria bacterium]